jgi:hypothetical protein
MQRRPEQEENRSRFRMTQEVKTEGKDIQKHTVHILTSALWRNTEIHPSPLLQMYSRTTED